MRSFSFPEGAAEERICDVPAMFEGVEFWVAGEVGDCQEGGFGDFAEWRQGWLRGKGFLVTRVSWVDKRDTAPTNRKEAREDHHNVASVLRGRRGTGLFRTKGWAVSMGGKKNLTIGNAAVAWEAGKPLVIEEVEVAPPQAMEVRLKILFTSLCHTDVYFWEAKVLSREVLMRCVKCNAVGSGNCRARRRSFRGSSVMKREANSDAPRHPGSMHLDDVAHSDSPPDDPDTVRNNLSYVEKIITCGIRIHQEANPKVLCHPDPCIWVMWRIRIRLRTIQTPIVESIGEGVTDLAPGDHVLPVFTGECKECEHCKSEESNMCSLLRINTERGVMINDGESRFSINGKPVYHFLGTSTFSEYTVVHSGCVAKINPEAPLDKVCVLSCGISTGLGATLNVAKPPKGSTVAVFGLGAVGLAAAEGARIAGASRIIGVDVNPKRFDEAKKFGVNEFVNPKDYDRPVQEVLAEMTGGGVDRSIECTGNIGAMISAFECVHDGWGVAVLVGVPNKDAVFQTHPLKLLNERNLKGTFFGNYKPRSDLPSVVEKYMNKELELEKFITHEVPFSEINKAFDYMLQGEGDPSKKQAKKRREGRKENRRKKLLLNHHRTSTRQPTDAGVLPKYQLTLEFCRPPTDVRLLPDVGPGLVARFLPDSKLIPVVEPSLVARFLLEAGLLLDANLRSSPDFYLMSYPRSSPYFYLTPNFYPTLDFYPLPNFYSTLDFCPSLDFYLTSSL
ncbi:Alcohol dehydrogenase 3 [Dendrobium catenatum]|uniref:Alcohol dehydrogenase 1 n=1 Tax=Dendrobium catenatum TaxID=906689 RepID=A0A2I0VN28_9ASPA|nr:Alcohol dehydrogenase 3 [Dendrobium catenatum]